MVLGNAKPKDRSEIEIRGYRRALSLIHTNAPALTVTPSLLRRLHKIIQDGAGDAGAWKRTDNDIIELAAGQPPRVRFKPTAALATPHAIDELCMRYRAKVGAEIKKEAERVLKPFYPDDAEGSTPIAYRGHGPFAARHLIAALMSP